MCISFAGTPPVQMLNQTLSAMQVLVTEKDRRATVEVLHTDMLKTISTSSHRKESLMVTEAGFSPQLDQYSTKPAQLGCQIGWQ